jgi:hypothetical protein
VVIVNEHARLDQAQQIRRTMACIRRELDVDVGEVEQSARTLLNWKYYIQNYPWACLAVSATIGYLVVPRKLEIHSPDPKTLEKLARKRHLVVEEKPTAQAKGGLVGTAFSFLSGLVLKTAMAQLGLQLASLMDSNARAGERDQPTPSSPRASQVSPWSAEIRSTSRPRANERGDN